MRDLLVEGRQSKKSAQVMIWGGGWKVQEHSMPGKPDKPYSSSKSSHTWRVHTPAWWSVLIIEWCN